MNNLKSTGLKRKILSLTLIPLAVVLFLIGFLTVVNKWDTEKQLLLNGISSFQTLLESGDLSFESIKDRSKLEMILNEKVVFAEILKRDGVVVYSSENTSIPQLSEQDKDDINDAFQGYEISKGIYKDNVYVLDLISPLVINDKVVGVLHFGVSFQKSSERVGEYSLFIFILALVGELVCYLLISILLQNLVLKNIYKLKDVTLEMQKGNYKEKISIDTDDEISDFAKAFDAMRFEVNSNREKLENSNKELEEQVKERTSELQLKLDDFERLNRVMIDRELKMIEMKKALDQAGIKVSEN